MSRRASIETRRASRGETLIELIVSVSILATTGIVIVGALPATTKIAWTQAEHARGHELLVSAEQALAAGTTTTLQTTQVGCGQETDYQDAVQSVRVAAGLPAGYDVQVEGVLAWNGSTLAPASDVVTHLTADATATSVTVDSVTGLPATGEYQITICGKSTSELATVTGVSGATTLNLKDPLIGQYLLADKARIHFGAGVHQVQLLVTTPSSLTERGVVVIRDPATVKLP